MAIATRTEFIKYCYRSLGATVVEINVDDDLIKWILRVKHGNY